MKKQKEQQTFSQRIWISLFILVALLGIGSIFSLILSGENENLDANTAIIKINGPISADESDGLFGGGTSSTEIIRELEQARDDDSIHAVILEINSPGGSAVASDEIAQKVKELRQQNKTVVAWIREVGASGAYWIASSTDYIVANRMSITGSIGVISSYPEFDQFLQEWNVSYNRLVAGDRKDIGDPFVNLTDSNRLFLQAKLNRVHGFFIDEVSRNRNLSYEKTSSLADGRFFLGVEAKDSGLVDELGGKEEALAYVGRSIGEEASTVEYEPRRSFLDQVFGVLGKQKQLSATEYLQYLRLQQTQQDVPLPMLR